MVGKLYDMDVAIDTHAGIAGGPQRSARAGDALLVAVGDQQQPAATRQYLWCDRSGDRRHVLPARRAEHHTAREREHRGEAPSIGPRRRSQRRRPDGRVRPRPTSAAPASVEASSARIFGWPLSARRYWIPTTTPVSSAAKRHRDLAASGEPHVVAASPQLLRIEPTLRKVALTDERTAIEGLPDPGHACTCRSELFSLAPALPLGMALAVCASLLGDRVRRRVDARDRRDMRCDRREVRFDVQPGVARRERYQVATRVAAMTVPSAGSVDGDRIAAVLAANGARAGPNLRTRRAAFDDVVLENSLALESAASADFIEVDPASG